MSVPVVIAMRPYTRYSPRASTVEVPLPGKVSDSLTGVIVVLVAKLIRTLLPLENAASATSAASVPLAMSSAWITFE